MTDEQKKQAMREIWLDYRMAIGRGLSHLEAREQALHSPTGPDLNAVELLEEISKWEGTVFAPGTHVTVFGDPGVVSKVTEIGYHIKFDNPQLNGEPDVEWYESSSVVFREQMTQEEAQALADAKAAHPDCLGAAVIGDSNGPAFVISGWRK